MVRAHASGRLAVVKVDQSPHSRRCRTVDVRADRMSTSSTTSGGGRADESRAMSSAGLLSLVAPAGGPGTEQCKAVCGQIGIAHATRQVCTCEKNTTVRSSKARRSTRHITFTLSVPVGRAHNGHDHEAHILGGGISAAAPPALDGARAAVGAGGSGDSGAGSNESMPR